MKKERVKLIPNTNLIVNSNETRIGYILKLLRGDK